MELHRPLPPHDVFFAVVEYASAYAAASNNTKIMIGRPTTAEVADCAARMERLAKATERILALAEGSSLGPEWRDLPFVVRNFHRVDVDRGCPSCWLSSSVGRQHPECRVKIDRWFEARDALVEYGELMDRLGNAEQTDPSA